MVVRKIKKYVYAQRDYYDLKKIFPDASYTSISDRGNFIVRTAIAPDSLGSIYDIEFQGGVDYKSTVYLYKPFSYKDNLNEFPHYYRFDESKQALELCLYFPGEYNSKMQYKNTIVPWAMEWLYFFEHFMITGTWFGKEIQHNNGETHDSI